MIYFCADDYGLCESASVNIYRCIDKGALNKVSVFVNSDEIDLSKILKNNEVRISLHLNLVEGKCVGEKSELSLITDENGNFKHTFGGLLGLSFFHKKEFEIQIYKEIKAQVMLWKKLLPKDVPFCIDSHQHTHMIPAVFKALIRVLGDEGIKAEYIRIPAEPILPFVKTPSLYFTYKPVNIIKQWLLKLLWIFNKNQSRKINITPAYFFGVLFSGKMDEKRVIKILPKYICLAKKYGRDIEVLFHPGYLDKDESNLKDMVFNRFYLSENRKKEFDSVMNIAERSVN